MNTRARPIVNGMLVCILVALLTFSCTNTKQNAKQVANPNFVTAHSDGIVSRFSNISVVFTSPCDTSKLANTMPFSFSPHVDGAIEWSADRTRIDFKPKSPLKPGQKYHVVFDFAAIGQPQNSWFSFDVRAAEPSITCAAGELYAAFDGSLAIDGKVFSTDLPASAGVEALLSAKLDGKALDISWSHEGDGKHSFTVKRIPRGHSETKLTLSWNGSKLGSSLSGSKVYNIPKEGSFEVLSISTPSDSNSNCINIACSDPVDKNQDFRGLIRTNTNAELKYEVEGGLIRVYSAMRWPDNVSVNVERGLKNSKGKSIIIPVQASVSFDWEIPEVRFKTEANIIPSTKGTQIVIETKNLAKITVEALQVYDSNILQFLQVNELNTSYQLKRVGDVVWRNEIDLGWTENKKNQWVAYGLDLTPLLEKYKDGIFQLRVAFGHNDVRYISPKTYADLGKWKFPPVIISDGSDDDDDSYWDYVEEWFDWEEYYKFRNDPAHPAFYIIRYGKDRVARHNVLVSDVALSAKKDLDGLWHIVASDISNAKPLSSATIKVYSYTMQEIASAKTDRNGLASIKLNNMGQNKTFFIIAQTSSAKTGRDKGYLKINNTQALVVSHFDIGGEKSEAGIKGFIYGERGVWRPGDDIHLSFILYDRLKTLPKDHPIKFELENPLGQIVKQETYNKPIGNFYYIKTSTDASAPTGSWTAKVNVGGKTFTKKLKIEMVMPNRLKLNLDYGTTEYLSTSLSKMGLNVAWLHGASAPGLRADVTMKLSGSNMAPGNYTAYSFYDPLGTIPDSENVIFDGALNDKGKAIFDVNLRLEEPAPGPLTASFMSRAFEQSGLFSSEFFSVPFHPYDRYVGIKLPQGDASRNMLLTDKDHLAEIIFVDKDGKISGNGKVKIELYKLQWRWWWEKGNESLAEHASDIFNKVIASDTVNIKNGRGSWSFQIKYPEWGRYLIRATDIGTGTSLNHTSGTVFYMDWPGWAGRAQGTGDSAVMLTMNSDKPAYSTGETVKVSFPSNKDAKAFITIERSGRIIKEEWVETKDGNTVYSFKAEPGMDPNVYVHAMLIQPHLQTKNDLPIRLYGIIPIMIENPDTKLEPVISADKTLEPSKKSTIVVSERNGKAMTYTLAVVDEGLLGITKYKTPNPWNEFYKKEASLLTSYDMYNYVAGAYAGKLQTLLSIGGSEFGDGAGTRKTNRFPPVVKYFGPFVLAKSSKASHEIDLGLYVGAVRLMVVAGTDQGAFGTSEVEVPVKSTLMVYATAPRVLGPSEKVQIPVTVLGFMGKNTSATVSMKINGNAKILGENSKVVNFADEGEQATAFELQVDDTVGAVALTVEAKAAGGFTSSQIINVPVRSLSVPITKTVAAVITSKAKRNISLDLPGIRGTNETWLELSTALPLNLSDHIGYLIDYPHGCAEQTVSKAFPQIFLPKAVNLTQAQIESTRANVAAAIQKMQDFQTTQGGFVFWPGSQDENSWLTSYVTHFLIMAKNQGYTVPDTILEPALNRMRSQAESWNAHTDAYKAQQAYRLYVLALAGKADIASMNRFISYAPYPTAATYQLAAAYALAGLKDKAKFLLTEAPTSVDRYTGMDEIFGSTIRDKAILLDVFNTLNEPNRGLPIFTELSKVLSQQKYFSTQDLSYALIACLPYIENASQSSANVAYSYASGRGSVTISKGIQRIPISKDAVGNLDIALTNESSTQVYATLISTGNPAYGTEESGSRGIRLKVDYFDSDEKAVDVAALPFGSDIVIDITTTNISGLDLKNIALTYRIPSGWEIRNIRLADTKSDTENKVLYDYQDIRDDMVMTYFSLARGKSLKVRLYANKTYEGDFFMPATTVEVMYNPELSAIIAGRTILAPATKALPARRGGNATR